MKVKIKEITCKLFGHIEVEEVYALKATAWRYRCIREIKCARCGKELLYEIGCPMSRAELLQHGWFIEKNEV